MGGLLASRSPIQATVSAIRRSSLAATVVAASPHQVAECQFSSLGAPSSTERSGLAVTITPAAFPSALLAVTAGPAVGAALSAL